MTSSFQQTLADAQRDAGSASRSGKSIGQSSSEGQALVERIVDIVRKARPELQERELGVEEDLRAAGLNSLATVRLMMDVELAFDMEIPTEELRPANFRSISAMAALVSRLRGAAGSA